MKNFKNPKADKARKETYKETVDLLKKKRSCAIIRPTGFGKTGILTKLLKSGIFQSILYVYPTEIIKDTVIKFYFGDDLVDLNSDVPGVEFMTYAKFARLESEEILQLGYKYDLIIFDECHKIGGEKTSENLDHLLNNAPDIKVLGATATPDRTDAIDILGRYFPTSTVSEYTIHNAFQDGLLQKPYYVYCGFAKPEENEDIATAQWKRELDLIDNERERLTLAKDLANKTKEISDLYNMDKIVKRTCDKYADTNYMKFIAFFPSFEGLDDKKGKVKEWFHKAYPKHKIRELTITSETPELSGNVKELGNLKYKKDHIDLIYVIDMLNMGYHIDDLTGIIMYRGTISSIIYGQELGRVLSTGTDKQAIVFDVVDNLHNHAIYEMLEEESIFTKNARDRMAVLEKKAKKWDAFVKKCKISSAPEQLKKTIAKKDKLEADLKALLQSNASEIVIKNIKEKIKIATAAAEEAQKELEDISQKAKEHFKGKDLDNVEFTSKDLSELNSLHNRFETGSSKPSVNTLKKEDLIVIDEVATYRELIRKLEAEPRAARINRAWTMYLEAGGKYRDENGNPYTSRQQYLKNKPPEAIPIAPFCNVCHVTVDEVLDWILGETKCPDFMEEASRVVARAESLYQNVV